MRSKRLSRTAARTCARKPLPQCCVWGARFTNCSASSLAQLAATARRSSLSSATVVTRSVFMYCFVFGQSHDSATSLLAAPCWFVDLLISFLALLSSSSSLNPPPRRHQFSPDLLGAAPKSSRRTSSEHRDRRRTMNALGECASIILILYFTVTFCMRIC